MPERLLTDLDVGPGGALLRVALGGAFAIALRLLRPEAGVPAAAGALLGLLFAVKAFAAVARRVVPASPAVRARLEWRRHLARLHDSYQWRKLAWFGIGMLAVAGVGGAGRWEVPLGAACLLCGAAAEVVWRRKRVPVPRPGAAEGAS